MQTVLDGERNSLIADGEVTSDAWLAFTRLFPRYSLSKKKSIMYDTTLQYKLYSIASQSTEKHIISDWEQLDQARRARR